MNFNEKDLLIAQKEGVISPEDFAKLVNFLQNLHNKADDTPKKPKNFSSKFSFEYFLYYLGGLIIILTMGWFFIEIFTDFSYQGLLCMTVLYFTIFTLTGNLLWKYDKTTPAGLLYVCAVSMVPSGVYGLEKMLCITDDSIFYYILMEIATIVTGIIFLKFRKFPFYTLPISYAGWCLSMDIVLLCFGTLVGPSWGLRNFTALIFAILMLGLSIKLDRKTKEDYSRWFYIFSAIMLYGGLWSTFMQLEWDNEFAYLIFAIFSIFYIIFSIIIRRKVFMVLGATGLFIYIAHLSYSVFKYSPFFVPVVIIAGLGIIFAGTYYAKNSEKLENSIRSFIFKNKTGL